MLIAFTHPFKAFLPEIDAYRRFFQLFNIQTVVMRPDQRASTQPDVEWRFMGTQFSKSSAPLLIHEYASASLPPFRQVKDYIKSRFTVRPDFRLFLNPWVQEQFAFRDQVPAGYRDMGVWMPASPPVEQEKRYAFVYCGSVSKDMQIHRLLDCFAEGPLQGKRLLMLCRDYGALQQQYGKYINIVFEGPVAPHEVAAYVQQAEYAINYKPDIAPHNRQTATKLLEYCACGVPVITSDFAWVRTFQQTYGGRFFYLKPDLSNFTWENVRDYHYTLPDLGEWSWEKQIRRSGVLEFLREATGVEFPAQRYA